MTIVVGKIEPLKKLKNIFSENGITRFKSVGDIKSFLKNYDSEKNKIPQITKIELDDEIIQLTASLELVVEKSNKSFLKKIILFFKIKGLANRKSNLEENYEKILAERSMASSNKLQFIKELVDSLYSTIAGAIGENLVVKELQKLSDSYYLINDFSVTFDPPLYNKKEKDKIFSIQVDHLLICQSGVFILETKNWSKKSISSVDLRSPVKQVLRTSYALFVLLNSNSNKGLEHHHWGDKKIPLKSIIVMTNSTVKEEFKHIKVISFKDLNGYVGYFDEIFTAKETENLFYYLRNKAEEV